MREKEKPLSRQGLPLRNDCQLKVWMFLVTDPDY